MGEQHGNEPREIVKNSRVLRKCANKFDLFDFWNVFYLRPEAKTKQTERFQSCLLNSSNRFRSFHFLFILHFRIPLIYCSYVNSILTEIVYMQNLLSMNLNLNLKMTVERSKRRSYFLSLVFITKCFTRNLLLVELKKLITRTNRRLFREHFLNNTPLETHIPGNNTNCFLPNR